MIRIGDVPPEATTLDLESKDVFVANRSGSRVPVVHVLTWDTEADGVPNLVAALPADQPVYIITPPVADDPYDYPRTVHTWTAHVEERLAALDLPEDVVFLGWSFGGVIALELAQAHNDRRAPAHLTEVILIDSQCPTWIRERQKAVSKVHAATRLLAETAERPKGDRLSFLRSRISDFRGDTSAGETRDEMSPLRRAILVSWFKYEPRHYSVSGTLRWCDDSRARVDDAALGWSRWWMGPFRFERLSAEHFKVYEGETPAAVATEIARATTRCP